MDDLRRTAIVLKLIERMNLYRSWCGETHIQKSGYFLQEMTGVPMEFSFVLYRYGPFSFDLRDELTAMRADNLVVLETRSLYYGPSFVLRPAANVVLERYPKTLAKYEAQIEFVAREFGPKGVAELEQLATAFYVTRKLGEEKTVAERAEHLHSLKPHFSIKEACQAVDYVDCLLVEADKLFRAEAQTSQKPLLGYQ